MVAGERSVSVGRGRIPEGAGPDSPTQAEREVQPLVPVRKSLPRK